MSAPSPVRARVLAARRGFLVWRGLESALAGCCVTGAGIAVAALSGAPPLWTASLAAAALAGVLAALTLTLERWPGGLAFARTLDQRLGADGALLTAFECEASGSAEPLARLLEARVAAHINRARLSAALAPPSLVFVALALFGAALGAIAVQRSAAPASPGPARAGARGVLARVSALATPASAAPRAEVAAILAEVALLTTAEDVPRSVVEGALAALEELAEELQAASPGGDGQAGMLAIIAAADLKLRELLDAAAAGAGQASARGGIPARADRSGGEPSLVGSAPGSTMSAPRVHAGMPQDPAAARPEPTPPEASPIPGSLAGRWWQPRDDAVVAGYVERTRAALEAADAERR